MDPRERLRAAFPIQGGPLSLELVEIGEEAGGLTLCVRLIGWDGEGDARSIADIKEQSVRIDVAELGDPRLEACLEGWRMAVGEVFEAAAERSYEEGARAAFPADLVDLRVLRLKRAKTADDFCDALLQRSRLGSLLPPA